MTKTGESSECASGYLCLECFQDVALADCRLIHQNDGLPAQSGHWRDGTLCGPVVQVDREEDLTNDIIDRWKPPSIQ